MIEYDLLRQSSIGSQTGSVEIFGRSFHLPPISHRLRLVWHEDFPLIEEKDIIDFASYASNKSCPVITGCKARIHPYRLMYVDQDGFDAHLVDIPASIRGDRHRYPDVFSFVPALISIPPGIAAADLGNNPAAVDMYVIPSDKLLDNASLIDNLMIKTLRKQTP